MEHLEKGRFYRDRGDVFTVLEVFPGGKMGDRYRIKEIASHEEHKIWLYSDKLYGLADGLDGVKNASEDLHPFLIWVLTQDYEVFYRKD